jgi:hypothetical protein
MFLDYARAIFVKKIKHLVEIFFREGSEVLKYFFYENFKLLFIKCPGPIGIIIYPN